MLIVLPVVILAAAVGTVVWMTLRKFVRRLRVLERDLQHLSDVMTQMTGIQLETQKKVTAHFEEIEERIMDLSVPSHDSTLPLERRHQVLALARQGLGMEEIVKRLKAPVGEAELIVNLSRYAGGESSGLNREVRRYA